jgi:hypothetical protein
LIDAGVEAWSDASASAAIQEKLNDQLKEAKAKAADAPQPEAYRKLRDRVDKLNVLDFAGSVSTGKLFDALEGLLPPRVALTALDYDRAKRTVDIVAVSEASEALTSLFDVLDRNSLFSEVRLLDKKQSPGVLDSQVQVRLSLTVRELGDDKPGRGEAAKADGGAS